MITVGQLKGVLESFSGSGPWKAKCPAHTDNNASLSITEMDDGKLYLKCHAGCSFSAIKAGLAARGLGVESDIRYDYEEVAGTAVFTKVRKPGKKFFIEGKVKPILYRQPEVLANSDRVVFVVEGEKDVETLLANGFLATCGYEGSSKWREEYSATLAGRTVVVIPDNDEPGIKYANASSSSLLAAGCRVKKITAQVLYALLGKEAPPKADISDWFRDGGTAEQLRNVASSTPYLTPADTKDPVSDDLAERYVIASLVLNPNSQEEIFSSLKAYEFSSYHCKQIFLAADKLFQNRMAVDRATLSAQLSEDSQGFLSSLLHDTPPVGTITTHLQIIKSTFARRSLIYQCGEIARMAQSPETDIDELLDTAESKVLSIRGSSSSDEIPDIAKGVIRALKDIEDRVAMDGALSGLSTGLSDLDSYTDGLQASDLILLAARPGMGKTALAMNIVQHVALELNKKVLMFSLEMSTTQLVTRLLSSISALDSQKIKRGDLSSGELRRLTEQASRVAKSQLLIDDTSSISISQLRTRARREHKKGQLSLIVVDYLQLMRGSSNSERRERELAEISAGLKALAKELDVPVIALSQLNRALEGRQDKRPNNSDLRESGALEQDADIILFVYRECVYNEEASPKIAELIVSKHRNGPLGSMLLEFNGSLTKFSDLTHDSQSSTNTQVQETVRADYVEDLI